MSARARAARPASRTAAARALVAPALVALIALATWAGSLEGGFTQDDGQILTSNTVVQRGDLARIFARDFYDGSDALDRRLYRPLPKLSLALTHAAVGLQPFAYHLTNLVLHAAVAVVVYLLLAELYPGRLVAPLGALLFAAAPAAGEAVCNVKDREELLAALFGLLAIRAFVRAARRGVTARRALAIGGFFLLALLSKESAIVFPLVLLFWDLLETRGAKLRARAPLYAALAAAAALWLVLRWAAVGPPSTQDASELYFAQDEGFAVRALTMAKVIAREYLADTLVGFELDPSFASRYAVPTESPAAPSALALGCTALLLALAGAALWLGRRGHREVLRWSGFFAITLLLASNLVVSIGTLGAFRFVYAPMLGLWALVALGADRLWARAGAAAPPWRTRARLGLVALFALALARDAWAGAREAKVWRSNDSALARVIALHPDYPRYQAQAAEAALSAAIRDRTTIGDEAFFAIARPALALLARVDELWLAHPENLRGSDLADYVSFLNSYARSAIAAGALGRAEELARRALDLDERAGLGGAYLSGARLDLGRALLARRDPRAVAVLEEAVRAGARDPLVYIAFAKALAAAGRGAEALPLLEDAAGRLNGLISSPSGEKDLLYLRNYLAFLELGAGRPDAAAALAAETIARARALGETGPYALTAAMYLARAELDRGRPAAALALEPVLRTSPGTPKEITALVDLLANAALARGDPRGAAALCGLAEHALPAPWSTHFHDRALHLAIERVELQEPDVAER